MVLCLVHVLSASSSSNKQVLVLRVEIEDEISGRSVVVPADSRLFKAPRRQLREKIHQSSRESFQSIGRDVISS